MKIAQEVDTFMLKPIEHHSVITGVMQNWPEITQFSHISQSLWEHIAIHSTTKITYFKVR